jgi:hypothetical protein
MILVKIGNHWLNPEHVARVYADKNGSVIVELASGTESRFDSQTPENVVFELEKASRHA